jgi:HAD superfamily hydrolase (TIGR01490 family)
MKKIGIFDLDGTVYTHTLTFSVAEELFELPQFSQEKATVDDARVIWKQRGSTEAYWTYNKTILAVFEKMLPQVAPQQLSGAVQTILKTKGSYCYAYTTQLIKQLKDEGRTLVAISGSIREMVEPFAKALDFDIVVASELEIVNGAYTGKRATQTNKDKHALLNNLVQEHGLTLEDSIGIGDTHRDASILEIVANPIAFNPNAALFEVASKNGWKVVVERKNMVYELSREKDGYVVSNTHPTFANSHNELTQ